MNTETSLSPYVHSILLNPQMDSVWSSFLKNGSHEIDWDSFKLEGIKFLNNEWL